MFNQHNTELCKHKNIKISVVFFRIECEIDSGKIVFILRWD
jgi:hypothetical protein